MYKIRKFFVSFITGIIIPIGAMAQVDSIDQWKVVLSSKILPNWASTSSFDVVLREVDIADHKADSLLLACKTREELKSYCTKLRTSMCIGLGDLPTVKCPLNGKTFATVNRNGYRIEKIIFESWPGIHVTANLFLPDSTKFHSPYPAILQPCGHTTESKGSASYQRLCVLAVQQGFAVLIIDAINAGERQQGMDKITESWNGHNRIGALADCIGQSFGGFRVWDATRALDYLDTRSDIRHDGYGCFGNSGGGNVTALITALDERIVASAANGYITTFCSAARDASIGPGDAEQNIFNQLNCGVNHLAFCLMRSPVPYLIGGTSGDEVFPFIGTAETYENLKNILTNLGWNDRATLIWGEGLHGYRESTRQAAVSWMKKWLLQDSSSWTEDIYTWQAMDNGFDLSAPGTDVGLAGGKDWVTPYGDVRNIPGNRTYYDLLRSELDTLLNRRGCSKIDSKTVKHVAGIRTGSSTGFLLYDKFKIIKNRDFTAEFGTFKFTNGLVLPSILLQGSDTTNSPLIIVSNDEFSNHSKDAENAVKEGHPVLLISLIGCGEIAKTRRGHYGIPFPEEEMSVLLRSLGRTCVGVQAEEILIAAENLHSRFSRQVEIQAHERTCVAAEHARAVEPDIIKAVKQINPPVSWKTAIKESMRIPFAITVPGALKFYDWTDL